MSRLRGLNKIPHFGVWIYALKTLRELGNSGTSIDVYLASKFDFGSNHTSRILYETERRGLTLKSDNFKSYPGHKRLYAIHYLTKNGEALLDNRLKYIEVRPHSRFVVLEGSTREIESTGYKTSPIYGQRLVSTWMSPLPEGHKMESGLNEVTGITYADAIMRLVEARAIERKREYKVCEYEGDMDPNFIPIQVVRGTARDTYYVNPLELKITCEIKQAFGFEIEIAYWPLEMAGNEITRKDQLALGYVLKYHGDRFALQSLYKYSKVLEGEPEAFLSKYGDYLQLLHFSVLPAKQVCSELNTDICFS